MLALLSLSCCTVFVRPAHQLPLLHGCLLVDVVRGRVAETLCPDQRRGLAVAGKLRGFHLQGRAQTGQVWKPQRTKGEEKQ
jgi:hypothetical protein